MTAETRTSSGASTGLAAAEFPSFAATLTLLTLNDRRCSEWMISMASRWIERLENARSRAEPLLARALAHLRALQARFRDKSMNYAIEIRDTLGEILDSHFSAIAQVIDSGRGEVIRTLDPLHPMQGRKRS